ncbi:hypothetical protein BOX15_Mlig020678g2, partial [Macrostomum lignano]
ESFATKSQLSKMRAAVLQLIVVALLACAVASSSGFDLSSALKGGSGPSQKCEEERNCLPVSCRRYSRFSFCQASCEVCRVCRFHRNIMHRGIDGQLKRTVYTGRVLSKHCRNCRDYCIPSHSNKQCAGRVWCAKFHP